MGRDPVSVGEAICGAVARAGRSQERENGSTSVETTCHLSVRALDLYLDRVGFGNDAGRMFLAVGPNRLSRAPLDDGHLALDSR